MNITLMLADSAQAVGGKLYVLGGGWTDTPVGPDGHVPPQALAVIIHVPWDQANKGHRMRVRLVDADGVPVSAREGQPLQVESNFEIGRPPGAQPGVSLPVPLALNLGPLPLQPGRYIWELLIDDEPTWSSEVGFTVRPLGAAVGSSN